MTKISIYDYINGSISKTKWQLSSLLALMLTLVMGSITLRDTVYNEKKILAALAPHLSYLITINDRTEIMRILSTVDTPGTNPVSVIRNGTIYAHSINPELIDTTIASEKFIPLFGANFSAKKIYVKYPLPSAGSILLLELSLRNILTKLATFMGGIFLFSLGCLQFLSSRVGKHLSKVLKSIKILENQVQRLSDENHEETEIEFIELDNIRTELNRTKANLTLAKELLAIQKAKEINMEIYKRLIHDLQNPITAMNTLITLLDEEDTDIEIRKEALDALPKIADEILCQIVATKKNFEFDTNTFKRVDIRSFIQEALVQIKSTNPDNYHKVTYIVPNSPVYTACDPPSLKRAVINILENGLDFSREKLEIWLTQTEESTSIHISDDGPGMEEGQFEEIMRGTTRSGKGNRAALGLSSVSHILKNHNGVLKFKKSSMGGSEFQLLIGVL